MDQSTQLLRSEIIDCSPYTLAQVYQSRFYFSKYKFEGKQVALRMINTCWPLKHYYSHTLKQWFTSARRSVSVFMINFVSAGGHSGKVSAF